MIARIMKAREEITVIGVDMSRAFDTLDRSKMLTSLRIIIDEDSWRKIYTLLDNTTLQARIGSALSTPFSTYIGAPQGDSLSPVLYLELAMRDLRTACPRDETVPPEIIYADDTDFFSTSRETLDKIEPIAKTVLESWNLAMNTEKSDWKTLKREKGRDLAQYQKARHASRRSGRDAAQETAVFRCF